MTAPIVYATPGGKVCVRLWLAGAAMVLVTACPAVDHFDFNHLLSASRDDYVDARTAFLALPNAKQILLVAASRDPDPVLSLQIRVLRLYLDAHPVVVEFDRRLAEIRHVREDVLDLQLRREVLFFQGWVRGVFDEADPVTIGLRHLRMAEFLWKEAEGQWRLIMPVFEVGSADRLLIHSLQWDASPEARKGCISLLFGYFEREESPGPVARQVFLNALGYKDIPWTILTDREYARSILAKVFGSGDAALVAGLIQDSHLEPYADSFLAAVSGSSKDESPGP